MKAEPLKVRRPKYFIANVVCGRLDQIVFVQKSESVPFVPVDTDSSKCSIAVSVCGGQYPVVLIPCRDKIEQTAIFAQLSTILAAL